MSRGIQKLQTMLRDRPLLLLAAAALLHISIAAAVLGVGRLQIMPKQFAVNGIGEFASDSFFYQKETAYLVTLLSKGDIAAWATWPTQLHLRLYAIPTAALSRWTNFNVLTIEPLNLLYYLAIVILVFELGKEIFDRRTGLLAAIIVAVWPSLLLHTTQLLRDPLIILAVLTLILSVVRGLQREYVWHRGLVLGLMAAFSLLIIRIVRLPMWGVAFVTVGLFTLFVLVRMIRARRIIIGNLALAAVMIFAVLILPQFQPLLRNQQDAKAVRQILPENIEKLPLAQQIAIRRDAFANVNRELSDDGLSAGSPVDNDVHLKSALDIIRYLPRAAIVGFFSPFPNLWLSSGAAVGLSGRVLSGIETVFTYGLECLALVGLWRARKQMAAWLLFVVVWLGVLALGLIVSNVGSLYRLRYSFWIMIVIIGAGGATHFLRHRSRADEPLTAGPLLTPGSAA